METGNLFEQVMRETRQAKSSGLTADQVRKLERLHNYSTRYELVATHSNGQQVLIGYTRKGRNGLFSMISKNGEAWVKFSGQDSIHFAKRVNGGATSGDWKINFSGRTQREAIIAGELPFFATL